MENDLFWHVSNLGYPPYGKTSKGRLNREGDPILYAAFSPAAALVEVQAKTRQIIAIAVIEELPGHANQVQFFPVGIPPSGLYATPIRDTRERLAQEYLYGEITKRVDAGSEHQYNSTIAIADNFLSKPVLRPRDGVRLAAGLIYPSVRAGCHLDENSYNIALKPHVFDAHYKIVEVTAYVAISTSQSDYSIERLNKATVRTAAWSGITTRLRPWYRHIRVSRIIYDPPLTPERWAYRCTPRGLAVSAGVIRKRPLHE